MSPALPKPAKGTALIERKQRRKAIEAFEDREKQIVRVRDRKCRWPRCPHCKAFRPRLEVAHVIAKGAGGSSEAANMMLLDFLTHQGGPTSLEQHGRKIEPLTADGANGPCSFWISDGVGGWVLVGEETSIGVYRRD